MTVYLIDRFNELDDSLCPLYFVLPNLFFFYVEAANSSGGNVSAAGRERKTT